MVLLPIVFDTSYKFKVGSLAVMAALHGLAIEFGLFAQRAYIVLVHPEKNTKEAVMNRASATSQLLHAERVSMLLASRQTSLSPTSAKAFESRFSMPTFGGKCSPMAVRVDRQLSLPESSVDGGVQETSFSIDDEIPLQKLSPDSRTRRPSAVDRFKRIFSPSRTTSTGGSSSNEQTTEPFECKFTSMSEIRQKERRFYSTSVGSAPVNKGNSNGQTLQSGRKASASILLPSALSSRPRFFPGIVKFFLDIVTRKLIAHYSLNYSSCLFNHHFTRHVLYTT